MRHLSSDGGEVGEVEAKIHLVFWRKNDCLFFWVSVEIHGAVPGILC